MSVLLLSADVCSSEFFFFKQKTAYEIVDCDWSSDVCSSDLLQQTQAQLMEAQAQADHWQTITQAMEANRLWQLRNAWVGLKGALGLRKE